MHGIEDELADARSMGSLDNPAALFLLADTEAAFMGRLEAQATALRGRLEGVMLRDLARCDAANAAAAATAAVAGAGAGTAGSGAGAAAPGSGSSEPPCKKRRVE